MNYTLRDYQEKGKQELRSKLIQGKNKVIYYAATGSGKGLSMADIAKESINKGNRVLVIMRRKGLVHQTAKNFKKYINHDSFIMQGNFKSNGNKSIVIASIDTIRNRIKKPKYEYLKAYEVVIIDEAHDTTGTTYKETMEGLNPRIIIGFTATPYRIGNKTHEFWQDYVCPITPMELKDQGYLCDAKVFAPECQIDTTGIKTQNGDYNQAQLYEAASPVVGDIVDTYKEFGKGLPAICFCVNTDHAKLITKKFISNGIPAGYSDANTSVDRRKELIAEIESGEITVICGVNTFSTGIDIPIATVAILARPTKSMVLHVQQIGRVLRPHPDKNHAIILDHSGNTLRHGMPFDYREPELQKDPENNKKKEKSISIKTCPECFFIYQKEPKCPDCGYEPPQRKPKTVDGKLKLVEHEGLAREWSYGIIQNEYMRLLSLEEKYGWKPLAKIFMIYDKFGEAIFPYQKELGIPQWFINKKQTEADITSIKLS